MRRYADPAGVAILLYAVALALRLATGPSIIDDAFITFRYARNAAEGLGLVYNSGEHVLGATTPLWMLVLTVAAKLGLDLPATGFALGAMSDATVPAFVYLIGRSLFGARLLAVIPALVYTVHPFAVHMSVSGMEMGLFMALAVIGSWLYLTGRISAAVLAAALLALTRPEGFALLGLMLAHLFWRHKRLPLRPALLSLVVTAPWLAFATLYYGSPVPHSILAKNSAYQGYLALSFAHIWPIVLQTAGSPARFFGVGPSFLFAFLCALSPAVLALRRPGLVPMVFFHLAILAEIVAIVATGRLVFHWYLLPLLIGTPLGMVAVSRYRHLRVAPSAAALILFASAWTGWSSGPHGLLPVSPAWLAPEGERNEAYREVARLLAPQVSSQTVLATNEIGILGYELPARILDTVGLVSPEALKYHGAAGLWGDLQPALLAERQPDYVVAHELFVQQSLGLESEFREQYELLASFQGPERGGYDRAMVFKRKDPSLPPMSTRADTTPSVVGR